MTFNIFDDNIGKVEYISHMGSDLSVVNAARVSFGTHKKDLDDNHKNRGAFMGNAFKLGTELVAAVAVGAIIGFIL